MGASSVTATNSKPNSNYTNAQSTMFSSVTTSSVQSEKPKVSSATTNSNSANENSYIHKKRKLRPPPPVAVVRPLQPVPETNNPNSRNSSSKPQKTCENLNATKSEKGNGNNQQQLSISGSSSDSAVTLPVKKRKNCWNDMEMYIQMRKQIEQKRRDMFPVHPKPPEGFKDYLMNKKTYLLQDNASDRLRSMPLIQPPPSLKGPLREFFVIQEKERFKLRTKHMVEKEKLILAVEQEILRVHGRAARALANQTVPFSVCTILRDEDIYNPNEAGSQRTGAGLGGLHGSLSERGGPQNSCHGMPDSKKDSRSRYNGRLFLSWLQDVDDKWEKIKEQMVLRHHNEAESLNAVQKMDWEWKVNEITGGTGDGVPTQMDDLHIPMINVSDDFDLANG